MPRRFILAILFAASFCWASNASAQATDRKALVERSRQQYREGVKAYPLLTQHKVEDVLRIRLDGASLQLETSIEPDHDYTQRRAEIDGIDEPAIILCWLISQDLGQVQFEMNLEDFSDPTAVGHLRLVARPTGQGTGKQLDYIEIEKRWQTPTGFNHILFRQVNSTVRLDIIQFSADNRNVGPTRISFADTDFATLRRNHAAEVDHFLRPILKEIHQEAAFAADPVAAWQVLVDQWPSNDSLRPAIRAQIKPLNSDDYRVRQTAAHELEKLGRDGAILLMRMDRTGLSPEQNLRLDEVVSRFKPLREAEATRLGNDPAFLLDCLYDEDPITCKLALDRLRKITGKPIELDLKAADNARIDAVNTLRQKLFPPATTQPAQGGDQ